MSRLRARAVWLLLLLAACGRNPDTIVVCSKNFTESILLGEIVAQQLERGGHTVDRRFNLGGTFVCHSALIAGQVDLYVEYTGTAYAAVLELPVERDPDRVRRTVDSVYRERWGVEWTTPFGFENTFAVLVRGEDARRLGLATISDVLGAVRSWRPGMGYEFVERADGYRGLLAAYGLAFDAPPAEMDLGLTYRALADGRVDLIVGNSTDGLIDALDLAQLADDRHYFPPYEAIPIVRSETLARHPAVRAALAALGGRIEAASMRRMNFEVDGAKRAVADVAREFLAGVPEAVVR